MKINRIKFIFRNWKIGVHLLFRTKRFGVNNKWWNHEDGIFGWSNWKKFWSILAVRPIIDNWKEMRFRAGACHFMLDEDYEIFFGETKKDYYKRSVI